MASILFSQIHSLLFLLLSSSATAAATASTAAVITLTLIPSAIPPTKNQYEALAHIADSSLKRAHHLKQPNNTSRHPHSPTETPLFPRSYGGYSISLSFGTPPQSIPLVMDTGSSLVWVPCTSRYLCANCTFSHVDPEHIPTFKPKLSSSVKIVGCRNPKCGWLFGSDPESRCQRCDPSARNCSQLIACPSYVIQYGSGATLGLLLSDALDFPGQVFSDIAFGCSIISIRQPAGIAGFGRTQSSLPAQLASKKFSYCLVSRQFDDTSKSSQLVLDGAGTEKVAGVKYSPFIKSPSMSPYVDYYYVSLRRIFVGGKRVMVPYKYLVPDGNGHGGAIVDSGTTLAFMEGPVRDPVASEIVRQMEGYKRAEEAEASSRLGPCFDVAGEKEVKLPGLVFQFKGGAKMEFPLSNYFALVQDGVICTTIVSDIPSGGRAAGPAVIIGNYLQQNFYVEYDLENEKFGFKKQQCAS
ncbi:hypothetical protein Dimus_006950 [Dionaea muscipula]